MSSHGMSTLQSSMKTYGEHPSVEVGLRATDASKPSDELGAVLMVIELVLGPKVYPMQQHPLQWYAPSHYGVAAHPTHL